MPLHLKGSLDSYLEVLEEIEKLRYKIYRIGYGIDVMSYFGYTSDEIDDEYEVLMNILYVMDNLIENLKNVTEQEDD